MYYYGDDLSHYALLSIIKIEHIVNVIDLMSFLGMYGEEYGINNMQLCSKCYYF